MYNYFFEFGEYEDKAELLVTHKKKYSNKQLARLIKTALSKKNQENRIAFESMRQEAMLFTILDELGFEQMNFQSGLKLRDNYGASAIETLEEDLFLVIEHKEKI